MSYEIKNNTIINIIGCGYFTEYEVNSIVFNNSINLHDNADISFYISKIDFDKRIVCIKAPKNNKVYCNSNIKYIGSNNINEWNNKNNHVYESLSIEEFLNKYHRNYGFKLASDYTAIHK